MKTNKLRVRLDIVFSLSRDLEALPNGLDLTPFAYCIMTSGPFKAMMRANGIDEIMIDSAYREISMLFLRLCPVCGQPMRPKAIPKKPGEYEHASGCPRAKRVGRPRGSPERGGAKGVAKPRAHRSPTRVAGEHGR